MDALLTALFKHPARVWERGELVWSPVLPTWGLVLAGVAAVALAGWSYRRVQGLSGPHRVLLGALRAAARLGDRLEATVAFEPVGRTRMSARQSVRRGDEVLVEGDVRLACLTRDDWRPSRIPPALAALLEVDR